MEASWFRPRWVAWWLGLVGLAAGPAALAQAQFYGPTPYLSFADSPFQPLLPSGFSYFHLDDYETATRTPGYVADFGVQIGPTAQTDSVDWDGPANGGSSATALLPPGSLNGSGTEGGSWFSNGLTGSMRFSFDAAQLGGRLPTHVGLVWTDVGLVTVFPGETPDGIELGRSLVTLEAWGPTESDYLGALQGGLQGDGTVTGGTAEDRFLGVYNANGISSIMVYTVASTDWEMDHLQYGALAPVPEPAHWVLLVSGLGLLALHARRRRAQGAG